MRLGVRVRDRIEVEVEVGVRDGVGGWGLSIGRLHDNRVVCTKIVIRSAV